MHVIIVGAGEVGAYLGQVLIEEEHDVAIVESDEGVAREIDKRLDALVVHGSGASRDALSRAGIERADLVLAVTAVDEVNLIACVTARKYGNEPRTVARARQALYLYGEDALTAEDLGVDLLIGPERAVSETVTELLRHVGSGEIRRLAGGRLILLGMNLGPDSPLLHEPLAEMRGDLPREAVVVAVEGPGGLRIPRGDTRLGRDERIYVVTVPEHQKEFMILSGQPWSRVKDVLIIGGKDIGFYLAQALERERLAVTLLERDAQQAQRAAAGLKRSVVVHGDGTDPEFLREQIEEGEIQAVAVLLEDDEKSVLVGLFAKSLGARKVIVRCDKSAYVPLAYPLGIDAAISPRRAMVDAILRYARSGNVTSTSMIGDHQAEIIEIQVPDDPANPDLVARPLGELDFPGEAVLGAIVRSEAVFIPSGASVLRRGDQCLVVTLPRALRRVERFFAASKA